MPRISEFYGIAIYLWYRDHPRPHFHAIYAEFNVKVAIGSGEVLGGSLPPRAMRLVREWRLLHRAELEANWERARNHQALIHIDPLP